ncbi:MAG: heavy metal translocating P-type ATPase [Candidatus Cloacimonetes bacterium]|nr:heavy metal translocating P-type ATPase [Candidatus Cloacimonadota bacterium]
MTIKEYDVNNLNCAGCSAKIEAEIANLAEVDSVNLDFMNKRLVIQYKSHSADALERLNTIASGIEPGVRISDSGSMEPPARSRYAYLIYLGLVLLGVSYLFPMPAVMRIALSIIAYGLVSGRILHSAVKEVFSKQLLAEHFLMSIASLGALYLGEYTEAIAVMALYELGQYLENRALAGSRKSVNSLLSLKPEKAHRIGVSRVEQVRLDQIQVSDRILVYAGERIPVDGIMLKGESTLDASSISGESEPLLVQPDSEVYAGCLNNSGLLEIEVQRQESESMVSRIMGLIENASARKSRQERFITRFARYYTPAVVLAALLVFLIPVILGYSGAVWFKRALVFLIVSCPCALVISIPLSYFIGIGIAARKGIIFKGSVFLDALRSSKTLVFDKTGTLTTGDLKLQQVISAPDVDPSELEEALYLCEYTSNHPYALAVKKALSFDFNAAMLTSFIEVPGKGITLEYQGMDYTAGSEAFFKELGYLNLVDCGESSAVHLAKNACYIGAALFSDEIKEGMPEAITGLRKHGVEEIAMLSGDREAKAASVAKALNLDAYYSELLPADKLQYIEDMMKAKKGLLAFCGDGLNDAPVLARADIGIAMGAIGAQASIESADVILLNDHPEQLLNAFALSRLTNRIVWQNIALALGIKVLVMILGLSGLSGLWEAIIADVGVSLLVIFNSLRMLRLKERA